MLIEIIKFVFDFNLIWYHILKEYFLGYWLQTIANFRTSNTFLELRGMIEFMHNWIICQNKKHMKPNTYILLLFCNWSTYLSLKWTEAGAFGVSGGRVLKGVALAFSIVQGPVPGPAQHTVENGALGLKNRLGIVTLITVPVGNKNKNSMFFFLVS